MDNQQMPSGAYAGKSSVVKWVIIYLVIGAIIYGGLYLAKFKSAYAPVDSEEGAGVTEAVAANQVSIKGFKFSPATVSVALGDAVTWTNNDAAPHTVTAVNGEFDSGNMKTGDKFILPPLNPGTYSYYCKIHPNMRGTVVVK